MVGVLTMKQRAARDTHNHQHERRGTPDVEKVQGVARDRAVRINHEETMTKNKKQPRPVMAWALFEKGRLVWECSRPEHGPYCEWCTPRIYRTSMQEIRGTKDIRRVRIIEVVAPKRRRAKQ